MLRLSQESVLQVQDLLEQVLCLLVQAQDPLVRLLEQEPDPPVPVQDPLVQVQVLGLPVLLVLLQDPGLPVSVLLPGILKQGRALVLSEQLMQVLALN